MSAIPQPDLRVEDAWMASRARFIPWWIRRSSPATNWKGESVRVAVCLKRRDTMPEMVLKSQLRREILLLSLGYRDLLFFGLQPNTILLVLWDTVGLLPVDTAVTTLTRESPTILKHCL